jgi:hypothetical protein
MARSTILRIYDDALGGASRLGRLVMAPLHTPEPDVNESLLFELVKSSQTDMNAEEIMRPDLVHSDGLYRQAG